jgi:serine/threonine-protein kinase
LDKAHRIGIIHRDLKPENLFLANREERPPIVKILDFGIAKITEEGSTATASGQILGTPRYMAPEQATQNSKVTGATDLYALGLVAYRLLVGESYYRGPMMSVLAELLHGVPSAPSARHSHLGAGFDAWFQQACHREPESRFVSALQQMEALARALGLPCVPRSAERTPSSPAVDAAIGPTATDASAIERPRPFSIPSSKKRLARVVGAAFALVAAVVAYWAFSARESTRRHTPEAGLLASSPIEVGHDPPRAMPDERVPQPASATAAPPIDHAPPIASDAPRATPPAGVAARPATPAPRRKRATVPKPVAAPDPYRDQK